MLFDMEPYLDKIRADCKDKGIWGGTSWTTWTEIFHKLGFSSYKFCSYGDKFHYLSEDEFLIFALRYSA